MAINSDGINVALIGGAIIGLASGGYYLLSGRVLGISGIFSGAILQRPVLWRWLFVIGLIISGFFAKIFGLALPQSIGANNFNLIIAGLLVGYGTRLSNGCTSGHGVTGIARFSLRSLVAVISFIGAAILVVFITHFIGGKNI